MTDISKLSRDRILFISIDLQEKLLSKIVDSEKLILRNLFLYECARALGIPFVSTTQYKKGLGEITPRLAAKLEEQPHDKRSFSCCGDEQIRAHILSAGKEWIAVSGIETHICVLQTVLDLLREGLRVAVIDDAVGARGLNDHQIGLRRMERSGALIVTSEMLVYELMQGSDSEAFKKLLPLIKSL